MSAAEDIEVISDKEDGDEMASLQLLEKRDCTKSIEETEVSVDLNSVNKDVRGTVDVTNDESSETISKNTEEILLGNVAQEERETGDSDNQDEEMQLRWDDDELDEDDIKNEEELLGEGSSDTPKYPLSLQDEIIKTIEDEEKLLESEIDESKESPSDSTMDNMFVPKMDHNLNKPDIMLEIPSHELIEFSDDEEDLTNNLKMSPDMETDEEVSNANDIPMEEVQADIHKEAVSETPKEIIDENALEKEAKLAADILAKELNAMENDENAITGLTEINEEIHEDELLKDSKEEEKLLKEQTDKTDETFEIINEVMEDIVKPASESQEDNIQEMEDQITDLCEEMLLATDENESEVDLENKDLKSESPVDIPNNITETKDVTDDSVKSEVVNTESNTVSKPPLTSETEPKVNQTTSTESASNDNTETKLPDTVSSKETIKEKNVLDDPIIDPETKKSITDPQSSTSAIELETLQKESFEKDIQAMENNSQEEITETTEKADLKLQNDPSIDQSIKESVKQSDTKLQKNNIEAKDTLPSTSGNQEIEKSPELPITTDESVNETAVELPAQSIVDEPQPSTSFASDTKGPESSMFGSMMVQETSKDVPEMTDSLGLLAESSRVMEEDEEQEYDDDVEDEDDFDQDQDDESSNQMTAEHSEDSNAQQSETDQPKEETDDKEFTFTITEVASEADKSKTMECDVVETNIPSEKSHEENVVDEELPLDSSVTSKDEKHSVPMDIETVKLSDTSDNEVDTETGEKTILENLLLQDKPLSEKAEKQSPSKTMNLEIVKQDTVLNYVDLEESSSEEVFKRPKSNAEICREYRKRKKDKNKIKKASDISVKKQNNAKNCQMYRLRKKILAQGYQSSTNQILYIPSAPLAMSFGSSPLLVTPDVPETKKKTDQEAETCIAEESNDVFKTDDVEDTDAKGVLQTSTIKTVTPDVKEDTKITKDVDSEETKNQPKTTMGLEVFNLDSDEDEPTKIEEVKPVEDIRQPLNNESLKCINKSCSSQSGIEYYIADSEAIIFYDADKKKRGYVCKNCSDVVEQRNQELINGIKNFTPLLELSMNKNGEELVEISDSESEDEPELDQDQMQIIGVEGAKIAEEMLEQMINDTWEKFKMDDRLMETQTTLQKEMERLQKESAEINELLNDCQVATDQLRNELYATFEPEIRELPPFVIYDLPNCTYSCVEPSTATENTPTKRSRSPPKEVPPKRPAIPLGYAPLGDLTNEDTKNIKVTSEKADDDNTDVSVVKLSAESAPKDLPPPGEIIMAPLKVGMTVYAMRNVSGSWLKAKIVEILPKASNSSFTLCRIKFENTTSKNPYKTLPGRCLAYNDPPDVRMTIGRRVIALFKETNKRESFYSGIVAEIPNPVNSYRYLIFFDDGYAQYAHHAQTRLVCECSNLVWEEVHPYSREFVRQYLFAYPERPMVRLHAGQNLKTEWRGNWWSSRVIRVDASLVEVQFLRRERREWIYRGSTRLAPLYLELQAAERSRPRAVPRAQLQGRTNMPYVEYTRSDVQTNKEPDNQQQQQQQQQNEEMRRQRAVAKKSTSAPQPTSAASADNLDNVTSRVVYYTPKNAVKPYKMVPHNCSPKCKRTDVLALKDLRTYNPLAKPLLSGWERQIVRWKGQRAVLYVAPCGRRLRDVRELHTYLQAIRSDMPVDLFDFSPATHCLAEFVLNKCFVGKKDLSHGKENVPVPCVNYYDESLPEFCSYNTERTPTAGVPLNLDPDFLCGCDCEDDCEDKSKCACWQMTLEGARTIGLEGDNVGYVYKRLPEPLPSGIYECNSRCKCKHTCLNRVAQHPLQLKLQVFKTLNRGWGIRALNDVPKGAFLCVYAGNLLTDATANLDGLNEGDEYLAELDYIEVVEQMKEGYEEDIPENIKKLDKKESEASEDVEEEDQSSEEETGNNKTDTEDDDFQPGFIGLGVAEFSKRLRRRESRKEKEEAEQKEKEGYKKDEEKKEGEKEANQDDECITISDDEEVREPSCFTAAAGMRANEFISKYRSVRTLFGEDEACYIMDAKVQGNIGRYLNHSCSPNVFVQNVFVDTHDPRFPWVAFFALCHIRAGTELTWNYNYDVGSVPGKVLYCHCGASNCRGRLL